MNKRQAAVTRSLTWLAAYRAEEAGQYAAASTIYDSLAEMHDAVGLIHNAAHYREMANICRSTVGKTTTAPK